MRRPCLPSDIDGSPTAGVIHMTRFGLRVGVGGLSRGMGWLKGRGYNLEKTEETTSVCGLLGTMREKVVRIETMAICLLEISSNPLATHLKGETFC